MFGKSIKTLIVAVLAFATISVLPIPANAATQPTAFYVATMGSGLGIYKATMNPGNTGVAQAVTSDTDTAHTYRSLASDATHLYFADNFDGTNWDLVRTDFAGQNRSVIATDIAAPEYIQVFGVSVYYTTWNGGLYWVPAGGGTPSEILGQTNTAGLGNAIPSNGFGPFSFSNGKLYIDIYTVGLVEADWSFNNPYNAHYIHPNGYDALSVTDLVTVDGTIYVGSWNGVGYYSTTNLATDVSTWTHVNTEVPSQHSGLVYRLSISGNYTLYSTSQGDLFTHAGGNTGNTVPTPANSQSFDVTIVEMPVAESLANTGSDLNLLWISLGLLAVGGALTLRRKN